MVQNNIKAELEQHHNDCYGWALHCCKGDKEIASDVLQTAYLKILERQNTFNGKSSFKTWAFIIIRNTATDAWKNQKKMGKLIQYETDLPDEDYEIEPESRLDTHLRKLFFAEALKQVSDRQRQILQLVFYHELSLNDSAKVLGISQGSARKHYDRAKKALIQWFQQKGFTELQ